MPEWIQENLALIAIFGVLVVIGGFAALIYGLPFASKDDMGTVKANLQVMSSQQLTTQQEITDLTSSVAVLKETVTNQQNEIEQERTDVHDLAKDTQDNSLHIEGLEASRHSK